MSQVQGRILAIGLLLMALAALFPPMYHMGQYRMLTRGFLYSGYFDAPKSIHLQKLAVEWMFLAAATGAFMMFAKNRPNETKEAGQNGKAS